MRHGDDDDDDDDDGPMIWARNRSWRRRNGMRLSLKSKGFPLLSGARIFVPLSRPFIGLCKGGPQREHTS